MEPELQRSRKTNKSTGNRLWNDTTRKVELPQSSGNDTGMDARREIRVSVRAGHGRAALTSLVFAAIVVFLCVFFINIKELHASPQSEEVDAAKGVEAMFIGQMIDGMRKTVPENEYVEKSQAERIYQGLLDNEYARVLSEGGNFGIAEQVLAEIKGKR